MAWFAEAHEVVEVVGAAEGLGADVVDVGGGAAAFLAGVVVAGEGGLALPGGCSSAGGVAPLFGHLGLSPWVAAVLWRIVEHASPFVVSLLWLMCCLLCCFPVPWPVAGGAGRVRGRGVRSSGCGARRW